MIHQKQEALGNELSNTYRCHVAVPVADLWTCVTILCRASLGFLALLARGGSHSRLLHRRVLDDECGHLVPHVHLVIVATRNAMLTNHAFLHTHVL
jgi:hypothetical protein